MRIKSLPRWVLASLLLEMSGCAFLRSYTPMDGGRVYPKPPKFTIVPNLNSPHPNDIIDFNALYSERYTWKYEGHIHTNYFHVRFWPTGECIRIVSLHDKLSKDFCETFKTNSPQWSMGFYSLSGNRIAVEIYAGGAYNRSFGHVSKDGIHISRTELQYAKANFKYENEVDHFYHRIPLGQMTEQPDWSPTGILHRVAYETTSH